MNIYNNLLFLNTHIITYSSQEEQEITHIINILNKEKFQSINDLKNSFDITQEKLETLLETLTYQSVVSELSDKVFVKTDFWLEIIIKIKAFLTQEDKITTSQAKDFIGTTRKYIIPVLETLDKMQITKREGDFRILKK